MAAEEDSCRNHTKDKTRMLTISSKSRYGIAALLALAEFYNSGLLQVKDIAVRCNIPHQYLEQIFNRLNKAGIIKSTRGKKGGYELGAPPGQVTVLQIVNALEGDIEFVPASDENNVVIAELFNEAENNLKKILSVTLAELVIKQQALRENVIYDI
jgi:Rrf2 family protein